MKSNAIICAIAAASLGFSALSFAQDNGRRGEREDRPQFQQQADRHDPRDQRRNERRAGPRDQVSYDQPNERRNDRRDFYNARSPEFRRGGHLQSEYRDRQYVVSDYRMHHLSAPPRGQQWVQVGADYVLIAVATGLIAQIILSH